LSSGACGAVVARHKEAYGAGEFVADPLHYTDGSIA